MADAGSFGTPGVVNKRTRDASERKVAYDALVAANPLHVQPADDEPKFNMQCILCAKKIALGASAYSITNALQHFQSAKHQKALDEANRERAATGATTIPAFKDTTTPAKKVRPDCRRVVDDARFVVDS